MNNDPFEEFEFKPLTEGLGFHKKAEQIKADKDSSRLAHDNVARTVPSAPPATPTETRANAGTTFTGTLSAATATRKPVAMPASDSISKIMATLPPSFGSPGMDFLEETPAKKPVTPPIPGSMAAAQPPLTPSYKNAEFQTRLEESFAKAFPKSAVRSRAETAAEPAEPKGRFGRAVARANATVSAKTAPGQNSKRATAANFSAAGTATAPAPGASTQNLFTNTEAAGETLFARAASLPSAVVDGLAVLGISVLCLVIILALTKADLVGLLSNAQTDRAAQLHLAVLYVVMLQLYMLVCRSFVGMTLGEWSFDMQLGSKDEQLQSAYPLKVVARTLLITATGFILPIISRFTGRDLLQPITGLTLYSHEQDPA